MRRATAFLAPILLVTVACGAPPAVDLDVEDRPATSNECPGNVCLTDPDAADRAATRAALAACVAANDGTQAEGSDVLRLSRIEVVIDEEGAASLHVAMANVGAGDVMTYPGLAVEVVTGDARFGGDFGNGTTGGTQLYGIFACTEAEVVLPLSWGDDESFSATTVSVSAFDDLGEIEADAAVVELRRGMP